MQHNYQHIFLGTNFIAALQVKFGLYGASSLATSYDLSDPIARSASAAGGKATSVFSEL